MKAHRCLMLLVPLIALSCATSGRVRMERGPQGTIAYEIEIESSEPGARIEVNGDTVGKTPLKLKVFGDKDGTFHNFGSRDYVVKCYPVQPNQRIQIKAFQTGGWFSQEDQIPKRIVFDLNEQSGGFTIDLPKAPSDKK